MNFKVTSGDGYKKSFESNAPLFTRQKCIDYTY